ncbi:hypothetical protein NPX13_g5274 [Xylaria arbuscula]|uniref:Uncharacterized protein n=1 Tax=Xylaria arbuscula TaxID=114810 RepID=A0A9W8NEA8_9PEZI|nr:hypothetical protein NPX13_g5274 [Xylaria arbuscula]
MGKRKRPTILDGSTAKEDVRNKKTKASDDAPAPAPVTIQIVTGSYDRVLHGLTATISPDDQVEFADTFLFNAHSSAIRCLAMSPPFGPRTWEDPESHVSLRRKSKDLLSSIAPRKILENPKNRELGTLLHHSSTITSLSFPTRSKLISSSEDSSIAVTRTRDWSLLSAIKVPKPKPQGRPSGDTAALDGMPAGVNDFAVHPSMKLMISVSRGERCMRLWNLMTAKKAGVLNFTRDMLQQAGETKHSPGEGRKVVWGATEEGDEFCVGFDRDLIVFGMDSTPRCRVMPEPRRKIHEFCYVSVDLATESSLLAVSTEDGRVLFFSTNTDDLSTDPVQSGKETGKLPVAKLIAQVGGREAGVSGRIKDFAICKVAGRQGDSFLISAGSSDGKIRLFMVPVKDLMDARGAKSAPQIGKSLGTYETQNRITCLSAFVMIPREEGAQDSDDEFGDEEIDNLDDEDDEDSGDSDSGNEDEDDN